jgi:hypothetical protein
MDDRATDQGLRHHISELVDEEHRLRRRAGGLTDAERGRLDHLETELDQTWDLLRRRMAREEAGQDPGPEHQRPGGEVETYLQ